MAPTSLRLTVVVKSARGAVFVQGADVILEGQLTHANRRIKDGDEVQLTVDDKRPGGTGRLAVLGRAVVPRSRGVDVQPGATLALDALQLVRDGKDVAPRAVFGGSAVTAKSPRVLERRSSDEGPGEVSGLVGNLARMSLIDVIQSLEVTRKTARVEIQAPDAVSGRVFLEHGVVVHAHWNHLDGEDAFLHLVELDEGLFRVRFDRTTTERTVRTSTTFLIMDALRRLDEATRVPDDERTQTVVMPLPRTSVVGHEASSEVDTLVTRW